MLSGVFVPRGRGEHIVTEFIFVDYKWLGNGKLYYLKFFCAAWSRAGSPRGQFVTGFIFINYKWLDNEIYFTKSISHSAECDLLFVSQKRRQNAPARRRATLAHALAVGFFPFATAE